MALPIAYRFEYFENVISKHHLNKIDWRQSALWAFSNRLGKADVTIASIKQLDNNQVEIIKRIDQNRGFLYNMGFD